jgi:hypothetical protein
MHADRTNRVVLAIIGLIAVLLGVGGLLAAYGVFGSRFQHQRLLDNQFARYFSDHGDWLWPTLAAVAFIVMLLALLWLLRLLFSTDRTSDIVIETARSRPAELSVLPSGSHHNGPASGRNSGRGRTTLVSSALTQAVATEVSGYHGVSDAKARVIGEPTRPTLVLDVLVSRRADIPAVISRVRDEAVAHAALAVAPTDLAVQLDIQVRDKGAPRAL